jgi:hypothetical protein
MIPLLKPILGQLNPVYVAWYDVMFIYYNWVSTPWQWSVDLDKNKQETVQKEKHYIKIQKIKKHRIHKIENKNTKNRHKNNVIKHKSGN